MKSVPVKPRLVMIFLLLLLLLLVPVWILVNPTGTRLFRGEVAVDAEVVRGHVEAITSRGARRHWANHEALAETESLIREAWQDAGFTVSEQPFTVGEATYRNLTISHGPADAPRLIVGAHMDVCGEQDGADDNASALAALIELARLLAEHKPELGYRIDLVAFNLEEPPFFRTRDMGSAFYARALRDESVAVKAMIALDCIGYFSDEPGSQAYPIPLLRMLYPGRGNFIAIAGRIGDYTLVRALKARMKGGCDIDVRSINAPAFLPGVDFSDHQNFWHEGYPAVLITNTAFYRNNRYHTARDTADTLDYPRLAEVIRGLYAAITTL